MSDESEEEDEEDEGSLLAPHPPPPVAAAPKPRKVRMETIWAGGRNVIQSSLEEMTPSSGEFAESPIPED